MKRFLFLLMIITTPFFAQQKKSTLFKLYEYFYKNIMPTAVVVQTYADNGSVKIYNGRTLEGANPYLAIKGDTIAFKAVPKDTSWRFWCWVGNGIYGSDRTSDSIKIISTGDISLRARFHKPQWEQIRVVINQPNGDTLQGHLKKRMFAAGYDDDADFDHWGAFRSAGDSVHVVYYSNLRDAYKYADSVGAIFLIEGEFNSRVRGEKLAQEYYPIQSFFPTGGADSTDMDSCKQNWDSRRDFTAAWILGANPYEEAVRPNMSGFDCEFTGYSPSYYYTSQPGKWWNTTTGALTPQARYSPSWSAGLLLMFIDQFAPLYFTTSDGYIDLYTYRYLLHRTLESEFSQPAVWNDTSGYNKIDFGLISDFGIYNAIDTKRSSYGQYFFRDTDPYFKIIESETITTDTTWYELTNFSGGDVVTELLTADEREFEGTSVGRWVSPEENTLLPSSLEAKNGSKSLIIYDDVGFLGYINTRIAEEIYQAINPCTLKLSGWFKQPNLDPPNDVTLSINSTTGSTVNLTTTNWTYAEVVDELDTDELIEQINSLCNAGSGGNYMFVDALSLTVTETTAFYKTGFALPKYFKINEVIQTRTNGTKETTTAGNWDWFAGKIYFGTNPTGKTVKVSY